MISWLNFFVLVSSTVLMTYFYIKSAGPAKLEKRIGENAYQKCGKYRMIASVLEMIALFNYFIYFYFPLPIPITQYFPWNYWISVLVACVIIGPCMYIMLKGVKDAGSEALIPDKSHTLYGGIYNKIRHPQAFGEVFLWWVIALFLNSPFLFLYSIVWFPLFYWYCIAEEKDLVLRYGEPYLEYKKRVGMFIPKKKK